MADTESPDRELVASPAAERFLAESVRRRGTALCLSGGGFRAALFHLGALRRLNELGLLSKVDTISAVSGGSILAAHVMERLRPWPEPGAVFQEWEMAVAHPFRAFTARDLRTGAFLRRMTTLSRPGAAAEALAERYRQDLTQRTLAQLPERPRFVFSATDMAFGVNWVFERSRVGNYKAGYRSPAPSWPVARAVAASSCFPPVFDPMPVGLDPGELGGGDVPRDSERDRLVRGLRLTDGGVYDNMGTEPVWKDHATVFVCDGGATFDYDARQNEVARLLRYSTIQGNQVSAVRKRWLISSYVLERFAGAYWGVGSVASNFKRERGDPGRPGYPEELVSRHIAEVRTDMDAFSEAETQILENHGYLLADAAVQTHARGHAPLPDAPLRVPWPSWDWNTPGIAERVRSALGQSHRRFARVGPISVPLP